MARVRSPNRDKAKDLYIESNGTMKLIDIAAKLNLSDSQIRKWKSQDKWEQELKGALPKGKSNVTNKKGGQPGNKNAVGNCGGAPKRNKNAEKHGFFSKHLPEDTLNILDDIEVKDPLDILWENIQIQYAAIIRSQKIMYVKSIEDKTIERIEEHNGDSSYGGKWEVQQAWDKQANFLQAQSRAMKTLEGMIKSYDDLLHKNWDLSTEEQKARIEVLKSKVVNDSKSKEDKIDEYFDKLECVINDFAKK